MSGTLCAYILLQLKLYSCTEFAPYMYVLVMSLLRFVIEIYQWLLQGPSSISMLLGGLLLKLILIQYSDVTYL